MIKNKLYMSILYIGICIYLTMLFYHGILRIYQTPLDNILSIIISVLVLIAVMIMVVVSFLIMVSIKLYDD